MDFGSILEGFWAPNSHFCRCFSLSFFGFIFGWIFLRFFVDFWSLETLKIELPPAREHNFDKIDVFHFIANFDPKMMVLRVQNRCKIEENRWKKRVSKQMLFLTSIFFKIPLILAPKLRLKKQVPRSFLLGMVRSCAQEAPKRPQERPKRPQEDSKREFWEIWGLHFGRLLI